MKVLLCSVLLASMPTRGAFADSGGPYEFVSDLKKSEAFAKHTIHGEGQEELPIAAIDSTIEKTLDYYAHNWPSPAWEGDNAEPTRLEWNELGGGTTAHFTSIGQIRGLTFIAVRYLADHKLIHGNDGAFALLIVAGPRDIKRLYKPVYFSTDGTLDDHEAIKMDLSKDFSLIFIRRHYSGQGGLTDERFLAVEQDTQKVVRYDLFAPSDYWKTLDAEGWEPWTRHHYFDEKTFTWHHHIHREHSKRPPEELTPAHRFIRVPHKFLDGKLVPQQVIIEPEDQLTIEPEDQ